MPRGGQRGHYQKITADVKQRLIDAWEDGSDYLAVADVLRVNHATARSVVLRYQRGQPVNATRGGRREELVKLSEDVIDRIVSIEAHPDFS